MSFEQTMIYYTFCKNKTDSRLYLNIQIPLVIH
jgi:hypothetical protein